MPCFVSHQGLKDGSGAISQSAAIASKVLSPTKIDEQALKVTGPLFPAIAKFIKCKDISDLDLLRANLERALAALDSHLASTSMDFLGGDGNTIGLADCHIAPYLYIIDIAASHLRDFQISSDMRHLLSYKERVLSHPALTTTAYTAEEMIHGWSDAH